ncbi:hypothetical protein NCC49_006506 [Naganishia albida]|nr:hypothetical protein NCC49_006506 [Naganishia albida]
MKKMAMGATSMLASMLALSGMANAHVYNETMDPFNINKNQTATEVLDYSSDRSPDNYKYHPSPDNWRDLPTMTILLDKWFDGDPSNNDYFKTKFEHDADETQLRFGGDIKGLTNDRTLDYLHGMGIRAIYIAGTPWINMPWQADSYSALDFTLLDPHFGTLQDWRDFIDAVHAKGMYYIADLTVGTMGDMIGFDTYLNVSTPFSLDEHKAVWKLPTYTPWGFTEYPDFKFHNDYNESCELPRFYLDDGSTIPPPATGCYASDFDQYGDIEAFGVFPDWQRQLAKFASVQDRLREWKTDVNERLRKVACLTVEALDIDGIRIDKATQVTVDALAIWSQATRECATRLGKTNFFIPGEVTGGDTFGSLYYGRGRTPSQLPDGYEDAIRLTEDDNQYFIRENGQSALDSVAFHYSIYRSMARFLGMDGNLNVAYDVDVNFVTAWNQMVVNNDLINSQTGKFDPRHMFGTTNHDVFRWPALTNGTLKNAVGDFVITLLFPGIPLYYYGEEQAMYLFDNGAANYLYGRQPMVSTKAWQKHGCYKLGSTQYYNMPYDRAVTGCDDDWNSLDHFDPTAETRRLIKHMNELRNTYPALLNGLNLVQWGNWTHRIQLPGSNQTQTEIGLWTVGRGPLSTQSNETEFTGFRGDTVWMLYTNENKTIDYKFDCSGNGWISTPYIGGTTIKNLFFPYETVTLQNSLEPYYKDDQPIYRGCLPEVTMPAYGFKAYVPEAAWAPAVPTMTKFLPGHDFRLPSDGNNEIAITFEYDTEMNCESLTSHLTVRHSLGNSTLQPSFGTANCALLTQSADSELLMVANSTWAYSVTLNNAPDGVYEFIVSAGVTAQNGNLTTNANDYLLIRKGGSDNVMVDQDAGSYSSTLLTQSDGKLYINHNAPGADKFRYTVDWGTYWSDWADYETTTEVTMVADKKSKFWDGEHVEVQYWSEITGSAAHVVQGDVGYNGIRRFPQLIARGSFNEWGYDSGAASDLKNNDGIWTIPLMASWPTFIQLNVYGYDDYFYGDTDGDGVLDRLPPNAQAPNYLNISVPPSPHLSWTVTINDATGEWYTTPRGHYMVQVILFVLLLVIPPLTAMIAVIVFRYSFYAIKVNKWGIKPKESSYFPLGGDKKKRDMNDEKAIIPISEKIGTKSKPSKIIGWPEDPAKRRRVLIATLEYEIIDWKIKVKIGGLGVMSSLMGKAMSDCDMLWVVPKVKDLEYPQGEYAEPIEVTIFGEPYLIEVETHQLDNITYIILDSPVFRAQTKADPYPQRMDDLSSAIFYSTWNQAIAEAIRRYPIVDIYHINDYHGALAPLYLLPKVMPVCLSLHNAEFQGLWPLRTKDEMKEVCAAFNIPKEICTKYVQFGNTFNLLHAAASYISLHQKSIGVAGVSDKYGKRSWARYPALWTLRNIDSLPNPDPTDIAALDEQPVSVKTIGIDQEAEAKRPEDKRQAQEWAGLKQEPDAELFVFVGRWSKQKGVDLIADVFPMILEKKPKVQLITVGPVIDLYGRFAAEKLARLMEMYPDRVFSKPEFTALPPYLFSGADFALIPSRDEPFGLVAVEFGRKGALGVGSRLGGLGLMPGWWFPVESSATEHMLSQFQKTIKMALKSTQEERAILRARSAVQRFPVVEWRQRLEDFHRRSITASRSIAGDMAYYADLELPPSGGMYMNDNMSEFSVGGDWRNSTISTPGSPNMAGDDRHGMMPSSPLASPVSAPAPGAYGNFQQQQQSHDQNYLTVEDSSKRVSNRSSAESFYADDPDRRSAQGAHVPQLYYDQDRSPSADVNPAQHMTSSKFFLRGDGYNGNDAYDEDEGSDRFHSGRSSDMGDGHLQTQAAQSYDNFLAAANRQIAKQSKGVRDPFLERRQSQDSSAGMDSPSRPFTGHSRNSSFDSISSIMEDKGASSPLNKAIVDFTDSDGEVAQSFVQKLQALTSDNSKNDLCIEKYLIKSEKAFFDDVKKSRMSSMASVKSSRDSFVQSRAPSVMDGYRPESPYSMGGHDSPPHHYPEESYDNHDQHAPDVPMTRMQIFMNRSIGGWPLYTIIMSIGQLLSATSFQLTLLTGNNSQTNTDLYIIGAIFFVASLAWYILFRMKPSLYVLSLPWCLFAIAFFLIGLPSLHGPFTAPQKIITSIATWFYAVASAAGFLFFGCNFGEEAGAATEVWVLRACIVQGLQQVWVSALWYWGSTMAGRDPDEYITPVYIIYAVWPLAVMSIVFAYLMFFGLPEYYRQVPPFVPNFFKTLFRRKLVIWFLIAEILRNYWLSGPYGRNWSYLWNNEYIPKWAVVIMIAIFFVGLWIFIMATLIHYSKIHSWLMPIFAVGLGCPRWCQMLWGVSGVALYIPWGGKAGPYLGTCLWLWLGVLDAVQGVGLGMILLQTLSRLHVCATLAIAQMLGSVVVIIARATAPNRNGPAGVFPDAALWNIGSGGDGSLNPLGHWDFWVALVCQIIIIVGYFIFFRKEQLSKP